MKPLFPLQHHQNTKSSSNWDISVFKLKILIRLAKVCCECKLIVFFCFGSFKWLDHCVYYTSKCLQSKSNYFASFMVISFKKECNGCNTDSVRIGDGDTDYATLYFWFNFCNCHCFMQSNHAKVKAISFPKKNCRECKQVKKSYIELPANERCCMQ